MFLDQILLDEIISDNSSNTGETLIKDEVKSDDLSDTEITQTKEELESYSLSNSEIISMLEDDLILPLENLNGKSEDSTRVMVLIYRSVEIINKRKHLKIIGIDVYTGTTALIVDTNGMKLGLHSYQDSFVKLEPYTVIKAPFKYVQSDEYSNILRITGIFEVLGKSKIEPLKEKYDLLGYTSFIKPFDEIDKFYSDDINSKKKLHIIVRFSGTQLIPHNNKEQLKMGAHFANIHEDIDVSKYLEHWYIGLALLACTKNRSGSLNITVLKQMGRYYSEDEYRNIKNKRNIKLVNIVDKDTINDDLYNHLKNIEEQDDAYGLRHDRTFRYYELYDENQHYINTDYVLDGCDDDYFNDWEDDYPEYMYDEKDYSNFDEPTIDYDDDYNSEELEKIEIALLKEEYPELSEEEIKSLFTIKEEFQYGDDTTYRQSKRLKYLESSEKYEIDSILDDRFSINFNKIKIPYNEADIEDIPF